MTKLAKNANLTSRFFLSPKGDEILMIVKANDIQHLQKLIQKKLFLRLCTRLYCEHLLAMDGVLL